MYDVAVLTESRYLAANEADWYTRQVHAEDGLVMQALERQGLRVTRRDWADPAHGWQDTRSVLFRTTWDYFHRFGEFSPWLDQVSRNARLFNEAALIRWNLDKHYLGDLARAGVNVVPTAYVERGDPRSLAHVVAETGWDELILKPAISGAARHTYRFSADEAAVHRALYIAAGFGQVVAARATLAGAEGGCQAEVGAASGMAAAALVDIKGGTAEQCAEAFAMALTNLEGLVCDPVAGLVEIPCIKRNVIGAMNAVSAADMALAGVVGHIPADEVIDAMAEVGNAMSKDLRETGIGGLAGTPTGRAICEIVTMDNGEEED